MHKLNSVTAKSHQHLCKTVHQHKYCNLLKFQTIIIFSAIIKGYNFLTWNYFMFDRFYTPWNWSAFLLLPQNTLTHNLNAQRLILARSLKGLPLYSARSKWEASWWKAWWRKAARVLVSGSQEWKQISHDTFSPTQCNPSSPPAIHQLVSSLLYSATATL